MASAEPVRPSAWDPPNAEVAAVLDEVAELLDAAHADPRGVAAYARAADTVRALRAPAAALLRRGGRPALEALPGIGRVIALAIEEIVETGGCAISRRLSRSLSPVSVVTSLPGIGETLGRRVVERLGIQTREQLARAADSGRLATLPGFGPRKVADLRDLLRHRLGPRIRARQRFAHGAATAREPPSVRLLLDVDRDYRARMATTSEASEAGAPGPGSVPASSVWRLRRGGYRFIVHWSRSELAQRMRQTHDWVVIDFESGRVQGEATVVTEWRGPARGRRVVRGREHEAEGATETGSVSPIEKSRLRPGA